ncbi:MAG: phosphoribosyl-ATP diphosphatase [Roseinatronobacter sp.]
MSAPDHPIARLAATIAARQGADPETSWTAKLLAEGPDKCAEKFGEEAIEAVIEAVKGNPARLTSEAADVLYHLLVMCAARGVTLSAIEAELARREGRSGVAEKAARGS